MEFSVSSQKSEMLHFDGLLLTKSCTVSAKKGAEELSTDSLFV